MPEPLTTECRVPADALHALVTSIFEHCGMAEDKAWLLADSLVPPT